MIFKEVDNLSQFQKFRPLSYHCHRYYYHSGIRTKSDETCDFFGRCSTSLSLKVVFQNFQPCFFFYLENFFFEIEIPSFKNDVKGKIIKTILFFSLNLNIEKMLNDKQIRKHWVLFNLCLKSMQNSRFLSSSHHGDKINQSAVKLDNLSNLISLITGW